MNTDLGSDWVNAGFSLSWLFVTLYNTVTYILHTSQSIISQSSVGWGELMGGRVLALPQMPLSHTGTPPDCDGGGNQLLVFLFPFQLYSRFNHTSPAVLFLYLESCIYQNRLESSRCLNLLKYGRVNINVTAEMWSLKVTAKCIQEM